MKKLFFIFILIYLLSGCAAMDADYMPNKGVIDQGGITIFPIPSNGLIANPMPFFDGEKINLFYLHQDNNKSTFETNVPWYLMQTKDFVNWDNQGEVLQTINDNSSPDFSLGSGSVLKDKNGLYHAFYTGISVFEELYTNEKIQHATSTDLVNWTKHPENGFYGDVNYFRDPFVEYMESEDKYWMLVSSYIINSGIQAVLKLYKSDDLINWVDHGVFFNSGKTILMESPSLVNFKDYYYLTYSEQTDRNRFVRYLYTDDLDKPWKTPDINYFDNLSIYNARLEKAFGRLFIFGVLDSKEEKDENRGVSGNLTIHELLQIDNGLLRVVPVKEVINNLYTEVFYPVVNKDPDVLYQDKTIYFSGKNFYDNILFDNLEYRPTRLTFTVNIKEKKDLFGLTFFSENLVDGKYNIVFNIEKQRVEFYYDIPTKIHITPPHISINYPMNVDDEFTVTVLMEKMSLSIYINEQIAFSTRMTFMNSYPFGFFSLNCKVEIKHVKFYE